MIRMGNRAMKMKKVFATLRALLDVLENLVGQSPTDRLHRQILEEVIHCRTHDPVKKPRIFCLWLYHWCTKTL